MFLPLDPEFALVVAVVGAIGAIGGASALEVGRKLGGKLEGRDILPMPPPYPPLPRFIFEKPALLEELRKR